MARLAAIGMDEMIVQWILAHMATVGAGEDLAAYTPSADEGNPTVFVATDIGLVHVSGERRGPRAMFSFLRFSVTPWSEVEGFVFRADGMAQFPQEAEWHLTIEKPGPLAGKARAVDGVTDWQLIEFGGTCTYLIAKVRDGQQI